MVSTSNRLINSHSQDEQITLTEDEIPCIKEELQNQKVSLSSIRAGRIILLPAFRFPPKTLEIIFIHGAYDYYESNGGLFTQCVPTWVNVSYVCSHWRNIALNCPTLWTYHFHTSLRWTKELLHRSKYAPLKISMCSHPQYPLKEASQISPVLKEVLKHSGRIQELCLNIPLFLPAKLSLSTPLLKKLEIRFRLGDTNEFIEFTDGDDLRLHTLTLANCSQPWHLLNMSELKTLSLSHVYSFSRLNMDKFLSVLSSMQYLTVLDLEHSLPSAGDFLSSDGLDVSPRVNLPHLTLLALVAPLSTVVALLSCIDVPPRTQLSLYLLMESGTSASDYAPISLLLAKQFGALEQSFGLSFHSLCLDVGRTPSLTFSLDCEPLSACKEVSYNVPLKITLDGFENEYYSELTRNEAHCIIRNICYSLPLANVQRLHILWPEFSPNIWEDILGHMHGLRYMKLRYGDMPDLSLLSRTARKPKGNPARQLISGQNLTSGHVFVPALEELELHEITFAPDSVLSHGGMTEKSLIDALSTRVGLRDRLIMRRCRG